MISLIVCIRLFANIICLSWYSFTFSSYFITLNFTIQMRWFRNLFLFQRIIINISVLNESLILKRKFKLSIFSSRSVCVTSIKILYWYLRKSFPKISYFWHYIMPNFLLFFNNVVFLFWCRFIYIILNYLWNNVSLLLVLTIKKFFHII